MGRIDFLWLDMQGAEMAAMTEGHRQRLDFVRRLQEHFGERIDVFGRSLRPFEATVAARREAARLLDEYSLFPILEGIILDTRRDRSARPVVIRPRSAFSGTLPARITGRVHRLLGRSEGRS